MALELTLCHNAIFAVWLCVVVWLVDGIIQEIRYRRRWLKGGKK